MIVRGASCVLVVPRSSPKLENRARRPGATSRPAMMPRIDARMPMTSDSARHRAQDLVARGAERAQQRELPRALGHGHRERVEDQEAADEHSHGGEDEQRDADEAERVGQVRAAFSACSSPVRTVKPHRALLDARLSSSGEVPLAAATEMSLNPSSRSTRWASGSVICTMREPARLSESPRRATPEIVYCFSGSRAATVTVSPSVPAELVGRGLVDRHLVVGVGRAALRVVERVEALGPRREQDRRRSAGRDDLAVGVEQRRVGRRGSRPPPRRRRPTGPPRASRPPSAAGSAKSSSTASRVWTETSVPLLARSNRSLNEASIVSVKMKVPATKATPITERSPSERYAACQAL